MRTCIYCTLIFISAGAFGQDTNFATGPQYLITTASPMFARPISTPTLSFASPPLEVGADNATARLTAGAENQTVLLPAAGALPQVDFFYFYYGTPPLSVIEISFAEPSSAHRELPASILDTGVGELTTAQALRERGYGVTLPEAAAYGRAHIRPATHIYTNADIDRLHGAS
jgi:hypothetical protein